MSTSYIKRKPKIELVAAIDFGTDGTAMAFSYYLNPSKVYLKQDWNEKEKHNNENIGEKMKTNLLLNRIPKHFNDSNIFYQNEDEIKQSNFTNDAYLCSDDNYTYEFVAFGQEATNKYQNKNVYDSKNWLYFETFKMALFKGKCTSNSEVNISEYLESRNGIKIKSSIVFIESFKYIIRQAKLWIEKHNTLTLSDGLNSVQWILSVPAIWSDYSKDLMIKWFYLGGINRNNEIKLVYEPDCASISVQTELRKKSKHLRRGDRYILIDLGGGTADFACHEVINNNQVCEIHHPAGGAWGSTYIDKEFEILLNDIFGASIMQQFKVKYESEYMKLLDNFVNTCKLKFFYLNFKDGKLKTKIKDKSAHNTVLPLTFIEYLEDEQEIEDLEEYLEEYKYKNESGLIEFDSPYLSLNFKIWFDLFNISTNEIIKDLKNLLNNKLSNIKHLILVGGFSESKYIQYRITTEFGKESLYKLNIIIPESPLLCVVDGAARLGFNHNYVRARKLSRTYGTSTRQYPSTARKAGVPEEFISQNLIVDYSGRKTVLNCFCIFAHKNDIIEQGKKIIRKYTRVHTINHYQPIYSSDLENPYSKFQCEKIGQIFIPKTIKQGSSYDMEFDFGGTTIKVFIKDSQNNQISQATVKYFAN